MAGYIQTTPTGMFSINGDARTQLFPGAQQIGRTAVKRMSGELNADKELAMATADSEAQDYEAGLNQQDSSRAFDFAMSEAKRPRPVGGGIRRGAPTTLGSAGIGLAARNAAAKRKMNQRLALAALGADPTRQQKQYQREDTITGLGELFGQDYSRGLISL